MVILGKWLDGFLGRAEAEKPHTGRALTIVAPIREGQTDALDTFLTAIGADINRNPYFRFDLLKTVHFMRWVIIRRELGTKRDYLVFESNYDGTFEQHIADLEHAGGSTASKIYAHCE